MGLRQLILKEQERTATRLAHDQVLHAIVVEVDRHYRAPVAVAVRATRQARDFEKLLPARTQVNAIALVAAEALALGGNLPRILHPPILKPFIRLDRRGANR